MSEERLRVNCDLTWTKGRVNEIGGIVTRKGKECGKRQPFLEITKFPSTIFGTEEAGQGRLAYHRLVDVERCVQLEGQARMGSPENTRYPSQVC